MKEIRKDCIIDYLRTPLRIYDCQSFDTDVRDLFLHAFLTFIGQTRKV